MLRSLLLTCAITLPGFSSAGAARECLTESPWEGKIGNIPITMEFREVSFFDASKSDVINGKYYYKNSLSDLILKQNNTLDSWSEYNLKNQITGFIENYKCEGDLLIAQWKSKDGKTSLPIKANRIKEYSKRRLDNIKFISSLKTFNQRNYKVLSLSNIKSTGLMIAGQTPNIEKINQLLKKDFINQVDTEIECVSSGRMEDRDFESENTSSVVEWNNAYVTTLSASRDYCGGAHPNGGYYTTVYNLSTGELENTTLWLNKIYLAEYDDISKENRLGKLLSKKYIKQRLNGKKSKSDIEEAEDCLDAVSFGATGSWTKENKIFLPTGAPHVATACIEDVSLTYKEIEPFLSLRGKSAMQASVK